METKQLKRLPVGIETFSAYWHNMKTLTWRCAHPLAVWTWGAHGQGIVSL